MYTEIRTMPDNEREYYETLAEKATWLDSIADDRHYMQYPIPKDTPLPGFPGYLNAFLVMLPAKIGKLHRHADRDLQRPCPYVSYNAVITNHDQCISGWYPGNGAVLEEVVLEQGKVYLTDRLIDHQSWNYGETDRIHLVVEMPA